MPEHRADVVKEEIGVFKISQQAEIERKTKNEQLFSIGSLWTLKTTPQEKIDRNRSHHQEEIGGIPPSIKQQRHEHEPPFGQPSAKVSAAPKEPQ